MIAWNAMDGANTLRERWRLGDVTYGGWCALADPFVTQHIAATGPDWVGLDIQHGTITSESMSAQVLAAAVHAVPTLARVPVNSFDAIGGALDDGVAGVIVPMVESVDDAERAVAACRFPPQGGRSWGGSTRGTVGSDDYSPSHANAAVICCVMLETVMAIENAHDILAVPGVDAAFVGPSDLAISFGLEPTIDAEDPRHGEALQSVVKAAGAADVVPGIYGGSTELASQYAARGFRMIAAVSDIGILKAGTSDFQVWLGQSSTIREA